MSYQCKLKIYIDHIQVVCSSDAHPVPKSNQTISEVYNGYERGTCFILEKGRKVLNAFLTL